jgi:hypothetical protein
MIAELATLDRELSELAAANLELENRRRDLAGRMQAAKHQRDVLARAVTRPAPGSGRPADRLRRRPPAGRQVPRQTRITRAGRTVVAPLGEVRPETSSRSVQAIMLSLGALLLGIAAVVFVGAAFTALQAWGPLAILGVSSVGALGAAPVMARRGLTATAESVSAVGLLLFSIAGYALWVTDVVATVPPRTYAGLVAALTSVIGYVYHRYTGLALPRYGGLVALQFVLPMLAHRVVTDPVGWAAVFALMAVHNGLIGRLDRRWAAGAPGWQRHLAWVLHGLALGAAAGYASTALALAGTVPVTVRAGSMLVAIAAIGLVGTLSIRHAPLPDLAAGLMTLAVVVAATRVAVVAAGLDRVLLPLAAVVAATAVASRLLPAPARRGPQLACAGVLVLLGLFVAVRALRAGLAVVVLPPWPDDLPVPAAAPAAGWQLAATAATLTVAAVLALPATVRREGVTAGIAVTALATPASLGLAPGAGAWLLALVAAGLSLAGLDVATRRAAAVQLGAAGTVAVAAIGSALASPALTAAILAVLVLAAAVTAAGPERAAGATTVTRWTAGAAALMLPGATAAATAATGAGTSPVLAAACAGASASLGYTAWILVVRREARVVLTMGAGSGAVLIAAAALAARAAPADIAVALVLVGAAALIYLAPRIDDTRRRDRTLDGADLAAAAVTAAVVATLARVAWLLLPISGADSALMVGALLVGVVALSARAIPPAWRRGPLLGVSLVGGVVGSIAAAAAMTSGTRALAALWETGRAGWPPPAEVAGLTWGPSLALAALAVAAALALPRPSLRFRLPGASDVSATLGVLAVVGAPLALGLAWWGPAVLAAVAGTGYALSAVGLGRWLAVDPRVARARGSAAAVLGLYAAGASSAEPWTATVVLGTVVLVGIAVAGLTMTLPVVGADPRLGIGGVATTGALLAAPATLAALSWQLGHPGGVGFTAALAGCGLGLAALAALRTRIRPLLPYGSVGVAVGATIVALVSLPTPYPTGVYAAAAVLLAVVAELVRAWPGGRAPGEAAPGWVSPPLGALAASAVPAGLALIAMAPGLQAALLDPYQVLDRPWAGPPPALTDPTGVPATSALAALLLTLASALAAAGFGGAVTRQTAPVIGPGLALTLLISPTALGAPWPSSSGAALLVFTIAMLAVALTPPPPAGIRTRVLRLTRILLLAIGLIGGGAGLAGVLADPLLTWGTFGGAIAVGATAGLGGRTRVARLFGWLGAAAAAQLFALTTSLLVETPRTSAGLFLVPVAAVALLVAPRLPRLRAAAARPELRAVEWTGGYLALLLGLALTLGSPLATASLLFGAGLVLGVTALRAGRSDGWRRGLLWAAAGSEVGAIWIMMWLSGAPWLEAYSVPLAMFALMVGWLEVRRRSDLSSWVVYAPGIVAGLVPSLVAVVLAGALQPARHGWVLLGGVVAVIFGSRRRRRAPVIIGAVVTTAGALHLLGLAAWYLPLIPLGLLLLTLGANNERRQRDLERLRGAFGRMR